MFRAAPGPSFLSSGYRSSVYYIALAFLIANVLVGPMSMHALVTGSSHRLTILITSSSSSAVAPRFTVTARIAGWPTQSQKAAIHSTLLFLLVENRQKGYSAEIQLLLAATLHGGQVDFPPALKGRNIVFCLRPGDVLQQCLRPTQVLAVDLPVQPFADCRRCATTPFRVFVIESRGHKNKVIWVCEEHFDEAVSLILEKSFPAGLCS